MIKEVFAYIETTLNNLQDSESRLERFIGFWLYAVGWLIILGVICFVGLHLITILQGIIPAPIIGLLTLITVLALMFSMTD